MAKQRRNGAGRVLLTVAGIGVGVGLVLANRDKLPANIREFNKRFTNPLMLRSLANGQRGNLGVIMHRGRTSGRLYTTPVRIDAIPGGFVIPMPYGTDTDWFKNMLAADGATVRFQGEVIAVERPEIIDTATALAMLPPSAVRVARLMNIKHYARLRRAELATHHAATEPIAEDRPAQ